MRYQKKVPRCNITPSLHIKKQEKSPFSILMLALASSQSPKGDFSGIIFTLNNKVKIYPSLAHSTYLLNNKN